jgi:hypothetical protein
LIGESLVISEEQIDNQQSSITNESLISQITNQQCSARPTAS